MNVEPIFTLKVGEDKYINAPTSVRILKKGYVVGTVEIEGCFNMCDEDGLYLEVGTEISELIFVEFEEIISIREV